ncbi:type III effector protein [Streptomyces sp. NPDC059568]|uniref:type III effector protein n=1 Tax=Streptomyces sp. NPDC059568 TaxID=3346868 RepID=UPI0036745A5E
MASTDRPTPPSDASAPNDDGRQSPASFLAAAAALEAIHEAVRAAHSGDADEPADYRSGPEQALASLLLLRQVREHLAGWETGLIETARQAGASWADLAQPLGVASRQAAERRYLRQRPGPAGTTGEQRVQAIRERRAADRVLTAWARRNAADLRRLAVEITALPDLPAASRITVRYLDAALADDDPTTLIAPLTAARPHLSPAHADLAARIDALTDGAQVSSSYGGEGES